MIFKCKRICAKIAAIVIACSAISVFIIGGISIADSSKVVTRETNKLLLNTVIRYASDFNLELQSIENQVLEMQFYIKNTINLQELKNNPNYLKEYSDSLAPYMLSFAQQRTTSYAAWLYFEPKWSSSPQDIYYADGDKDTIPERQNHIPFSYFDNTPQPDDDKYWWYGPIGKKGISWTNPYDWTLKNNETIRVSSCSIPIYIDGELIGVVGTYYHFDKMIKDIENIKLYKKDYAILLNDKLGIIIHPQFYTGNRYTSDNLATVNHAQLGEISKKIMLTPNGVLPYTKDGEEKILAYARLSNGWTIALTPYLDEAYADLYNLIFKLILAAIFCIFLAICAGIYFANHINKPILSIVDAATRIGQGDLDLTIEVKTTDEVGTIANSLNQMLINTRKLKSKLEHAAYDDELTGGINLHKFKILATKLIENNSEYRYMLVKFDIDRFKLVNDLYSFEIGDQILINLNNSFKTKIDPDLDCLARVSGDEFIVLISFKDYMDFEIKHKNAYDEFIKRCKNVGNFKFVLSEGRYLVEKNKYDFSEMFEKVNFAHKIAKSGERKLPKATEQKICYYDGKVKRLALEEKEIENKMEGALANQDFKIYLQPKYTLNDTKIVGAEALVRWHSNSIDVIYPNNFIPIFEKSGFIVELDMYMLEKSCQVVREWLDKNIEPVSISVNFSRMHLNNKNMVRDICAMVDKYNLDHSLIEIEITETAIFDNLEILEKVLSELHEANFTLSMDDFGTGYSSLGLLKDLAVDVIKLDQSFFTFTKNEERSKAVIASVISMAKKLNIQTLAEGVETQADIELLKELGCDIVQGYYFSKPMPAHKLTEILEKSNTFFI